MWGYTMTEQSKIEKLVMDEIGYLPDDEDDAVNYLRIFIRNAYRYVKKCGADPDEQLFDE